MAGPWYYRHKLDELVTKITDSIEQLKANIAEAHVINPQYFDWLGASIQTVNISGEMQQLENSRNILEEIKNLLSLEEKRRSTAAILNEKEKKGSVKKGRVEKRKKKYEQRSNPYVKYQAVRAENRELNQTPPGVEEPPRPTPGTSRQ